MSKYTTELRYICENYAGFTQSQDYPKLAEVLQKSRPKIFDFDYPIFDPEYKSILETKILKHFYMREIGFETVAQFKTFLDMKMNEIMPLYNQYYKSELIKFDPMTDFDYHVEGNKKGTGNRDTTFGSTRSRELITGDTRELITAGTRDLDTTGSRNTDTTGKRDVTNQNKSVTDADGTTKLTNTEDGTQQSTSNTNTTGTKWDYYHDTPQGSIATLNDQTYLTNARKLTENTDVGYQGGGSDNKSSTQNGTSTNDQTVTDNGSENESSSGNEKESSSGEENEKRTGNENESRRGSHNESENSDSTENMAFNNIDDYAEHHYGKSIGVSFSKFLNEFRSTFMNIDMLVIGELEELFMGLW